MNLARVDQIAKAVLYEGYMLYPYRPSSVKNQQRWNFGVVYPQAYSDMQEGGEPCSMRVECLVSGSTQTLIEVKLRFLQLQTRFEQRSATSSYQCPMAGRRPSNGLSACRRFRWSSYSAARSDTRFLTQPKRKLNRNAMAATKQ